MTISCSIFYRCIYRFIPIQSKTILCIAYHGRGYLDNPMALHQYMIHSGEFQEYRFVWVIRNHRKKKVQIEGAKVIGYLTPAYFFYLARSKYWFCNCKLPNYILKKQKQIYLQTWHGTPLKRLAHDIVVPEGTTFYRSGMSEQQMHETYDKDVAKYNYMISPSAFTTEVFQTAFQINRERLIETGYPRNDFLSNVTADQMEQIKNKYHLPKDKKIILYAPTWRDNSFEAKGYTFTLKVDFDVWQKILGDEYIVLFKPHYLIITKYDMKKYEGFVYPMEATSDISELYVIADVLVTDYSSVFFDYAILKRPIYFYMYDLEDYKEELRGFYIDIYHDLPGQVMIEERSVLEAIKKQEYDYSCLDRFNSRFNNKEDGNACKRVLDIVFSKEELR